MELEMEIMDKVSNTVGEKIEQSINNILKKKNGAEYWDDEIAKKTEWTSIRGGGANFAIHRVKQINQLKIMLKPATWSFLFPILFGGAGIAATFVLAPFLAEKLGMIGYLIAALFTLPFILGGIGFYFYLTTPGTIDKESGYFWIGRSKYPQPDKGGRNKQAALADIHAIQLIEQVSKSNITTTERTPTTSYKIIFILKDASRVYVTGTGKAKTTRAMAEEISKFMDVPVWDAI